MADLQLCASHASGDFGQGSQANSPFAFLKAESSWALGMHDLDYVSPQTRALFTFLTFSAQPCTFLSYAHVPSSAVTECREAYSCLEIRHVRCETA